MESKTIRVFRIEPFDRDQFDDENGKLSVFVTDEFDGINELLVVITPVASPEERLREARMRALEGYTGETRTTPAEIVATIERVDAEFSQTTPRE